MSVLDKVREQCDDDTIGEEEYEHLELFIDEFGPFKSNLEKKLKYAETLQV